MLRIALMLVVVAGCEAPAQHKLQPLPVVEMRLPLTTITATPPPSTIAADEATPTIRRAQLRRWRDAGVVLAHLYMVEANAKAIDRAIMVHVLRYRQRVLQRETGRGYTLVQTAIAYSADRIVRPPSDFSGRVRWILELERGQTQPPPSFPSTQRWEPIRDAWTAAVADADRHLRGELPPDPCNGLAGFWGGGRGLQHTTDAPRGSMEPIVCHPDQNVHTYSTAQTRRNRSES